MSIVDEYLRHNEEVYQAWRLGVLEDLCEFLCRDDILPPKWYLESLFSEIHRFLDANGRPREPWRTL